MIFKELFKKICISIFIGLTVLIFTYPVFAAPNIGLGEGGMAQNIAGQSGYDTNQDEYTVSRTVGGIIRGVLTFVGVIFLVLTVYAGFLWMTASGSEDKITQAKKILSSSVIGLVIVTAAYGITALVMSFVIGAQAPSTDVGGFSPQSQMGCCHSPSRNKCLQTATSNACKTKWDDGFWYAGESCTPYISQNTGCSIEFN